MTRNDAHIYKADYTRLINCMQKAMRGEELTLGFFGGSITQGSLASAPENTYAYLVFCWWKQNFPKAKLHYINGGIGGTTSHYGVARVVTDMLMYQPDFIVVDFSVNDIPNAFFQETYEGLVRKMLSWHSGPAVLLLNNVYYDTGINAQEYHNAVGEHYRLPYVSIRDTIYQEIKAGAYKRQELTLDGLHPNDAGHRLVANEIIKLLNQVKEMAGGAHTAERSGESFLPNPMTANAYERAKRLTIREISPYLQGFYTDTDEKMGRLDHFKNGWLGAHPGDRIRFEVEAANIAVQYRKTIKRPAMRAQLILDEDMERPILLDGNFDEDWGECLYLEPVLHHGENKQHTVEVIVLDIDVQNTQTQPFYLMSLIIA